MTAPNMVRSRTELSIHPSLWTAATAPSGRPIAKAMTIVTSTSSRVRGERLADIVIDRPLGQERQTEIAVGEPNREPLVLLRQRQIEPHLDLEILDLLLTCTRTERHARRIARHNPRDQEDRDGKPDQDEQRPEDSPDQKVDKLHEASPTLTPRALTRIIGRGAPCCPGLIAGPLVLVEGIVE